jgi:hypothetical protein
MAIIEDELTDIMLTRLQNEGLLNDNCSHLRSVSQTIMVIEGGVGDESLAWSSLGLLSELSKLNIPVRYTRPDWKKVVKAGKKSPDEMLRQLGQRVSGEALPDLCIVPVLLVDIVKAFDEEPKNVEIIAIANSLNVGHHYDFKRDGLKVAPLFILSKLLYAPLKGDDKIWSRSKSEIVDIMR